MNQFQIIADNTNLDTYDNFVISLNYQLDDILDIYKRNTNFSKTITLPGTDVNNKFFKQIFDVNIDNINFNLNKKIPAIIRNGDKELLNGNLQLINITIINEEITYEIVVSGVLKSIINDTKDYTLQNLDLSKYNHYRNKSTIQNSWDYINVLEDGSSIDQGGPGEGFVYPYIINGRATDILNNVYIYDLFPAPYNKMVWDKMFEFLGYTYTSNFINSEYFSKLILPFTGDKLTKSEEQVEEQAVRVGSVPDFPLGGPYTYNKITDLLSIGGGWWNNSTDASPVYNIPLADNSSSVINNGEDYTFTDDLSQMTPGGYYTCQNTGYYDVKINLKVFPYYYENTGSNYHYQSGVYEMRYQLQLVKNNGNVVIVDSSVTGNNGQYGVITFNPTDSVDRTDIWIDYNKDLTIDMSASNLFMEAGDELRIMLAANVPADVNWSVPNAQMGFRLIMEEVYSSSYSVFEVQASSNLSLGNELINMNQLLPNIKLKDYFLYILKMFNLVVIDNPNKPNDLIIEPRDDYYKSKQKVKDWTKKLDRDKNLIIKPMSELDSKEYLYKYKDDKDWLNKEYTDEFKESYGMYSQEVINDYSEKTTKTEIGFSASPMGDLYINGRVAPFFAEQVDIAEFKPKKVNPRILFYGGKLFSEPLLLRDDENDTSTEIYSYPYCGMWDDPVDPTYSLSFGNNLTEYFTHNKSPYYNLFNQFHKQTLENITNINARLLTGYFHLTINDISEFDFRDQILIDGSYWRVTKIVDFNPTQEGLTKVILYKILNFQTLAPFSTSVPTSNGWCPVDVYLETNAKDGKSYYTSQSGEIVTEDCCNSLGGNYSNGICYLQTTTTTGTVGEVLVKRNVSVATSTKTPVSNTKDGNTINSLGVKVYGKGNYVPQGVENGLIVGDNNSIDSNVKNGLVIGDGNTIVDNNSALIGDVLINGTTGSISIQGNNIITLNDTEELLESELLTLIGTSGLVKFRNYYTTDTRKLLIARSTNELYDSGFYIKDTIDQQVTDASGIVVYDRTTPAQPNSTAGTPIYFIRGGYVWRRDDVGADGGILNSNLIADLNQFVSGWTRVEYNDPSLSSFYKTITLNIRINTTTLGITTMSDNRGNELIFSNFTHNPIYNYFDWWMDDSALQYVVNNNITGMLLNNSSDLIENNKCNKIVNNAVSFIQDNDLGNVYYNSCNGIYGNTSSNVFLFLKSDIYNNSNTGDIIYNNTNYIYDNSNTGNISNNSTSYDITNNSNGGSINNNSNIGSLANNSNAGAISNNSNTGVIHSNSNTGVITNNSNVGSINNNSNGGDIYNNSNKGSIDSNSNSFDIYSNSNNGYITNNSNLGDITTNSNNGYITSNSNGGTILLNSNNGSIYLNSNLNNINLNSNLGPIYNNNSNVTYISNNSNSWYIANNTNTGYILFNSNIGEIDSNSNLGDIVRNSNIGYINNNSNNDLINNNSNNGNIEGNLNTGYISYNSNNGIITNNSNRHITLNSNLGYIVSNSNSFDITLNNNNGFINNNSNTGHINNNINNGDISGSAIAGNISDPIVNK